jgi:hypothetical protein
MRRAVRAIALTPAVIERFADNRFGDVFLVFRWRQPLRDALMPKIEMFQNATDQQRLGNEADGLHLTAAFFTLNYFPYSFGHKASAII